tara:strand:+ start:190 stop:600 length:411 start_codon:yes stop_codon:yes gene_type:complete
MTIARGLVALILIPCVWLLHFLFATKFEIYEKRPIWAAVVVLASLIVLGRLLLKTKTHRKTVLLFNVLAWSLSIALFWWIEFYTQYDPTNKNYVIGEKISWANHKGLRDAQGDLFNIESELKKTAHTLLIFYRGHW